MPVKRPSKAKAPPEPPQPIRTYGCKLAGQSQFYYDLWAYAWRISIDKGTPPRSELFRRIVDRYNPKWFEWHSWTTKLIDAACENPFLGIAGCAGAAKSWNIVGYACTWWLAAPDVSSVIYCSTTAKAMKRRGWAMIGKYYSSMPGLPFGNMINSQMTWQYQKGNDQNAIMGIAVEEGETNKKADNIKGIHTRRQMVIIDEATAVPGAIFEAITNLWRNPREFVLIMLGNPRSRLDEFGKFIEPFNGWHSVTVEDEEWETTPKVNGQPGYCIRFDALKSPNILEGRMVSKYLPTKEKVEMALSKAGHENSPSFWSNERGFVPPEGLNKNVISESMLETNRAYDRHQFTGNNFRIICFLDPARLGGDRIALRFAKMGEISNGKIGIQSYPPKILAINAASSNPIDFQITEQCKRECANVILDGQKYVCLPQHFGLDATGGGADLADVMQRTWSPKIMRVVFSEAPSESPCSHEDMRPAREVYYTKRVEMYFRTANGIESGQLKGMDHDTAKELCTIEFDDKGSRIKLMTKEDYKKKFGKSPDLADCEVGIVEVARRLGFQLAATGQTVNRYEEHDAQFEASQRTYQDLDYREEEMDSLREEADESELREEEEMMV